MVQIRRTEGMYLWAIRAVLFVIPFLPLYVENSLVFPFITGKNFAFRALVELAVVFWLGLAVLNREYRLRSSPLLISVLVFGFVTGLADLMGVDPYRSFWSNHERMEGYITVLHLALYFILIKSVLRSAKEWKVYLGFLLASGVLAGLLSFSFFPDTNVLSVRRYMIEYGTRAHSTIGNPPFLASYLLFSVFIGILVILNAGRKYIKLFCGAAVVFMVAVVYMTGARGAVLAGGIGIIMSVLYFIKVMNFSKKRLAVYLVCLIMLLTVLVVAFQYSDTLKTDRTISRFSEMFSDPSVKTRFKAWEIASRGIKERPVLGWGQENFIAVYSVNPIPLVREQVWLDRAHNIIIDWLVNAGVLGLFAYLAIFVSGFYMLTGAYRKNKIGSNEAFVLFTALVVYLLQNFFIFDTINTYIIFFTLLAYIEHCFLRDESEARFSGDNVMSGSAIKTSLAVLMMALPVFALVFYYLNYKPVMQIRHLVNMSFSAPRDDSYSVLLKDFRKALSFNTIGDADVKKKMLDISNSIIDKRGFKEEGATDFIRATLEELHKEIPAREYDLEYMRKAIIFINRIAAYERSVLDWAERIIARAIEINPQYEWLYMAMADVKLLEKDYESLFANIDKVAESNPDDDTVQLKLAMAGILTSRKEVAREALARVKAIRTANNINIASGRISLLSAGEMYEMALMYRDMKSYQDALTYLNKTIKVLEEDSEPYVRRDYRFRNPKVKAGIHLELARLYNILEDRENTEKEAGKALKLDPALKSRADRFIY